MKKEVKEWITWSVSVLILFSFMGCQLNVGQGLTSTSRTSVKSVVTKCIDEELSTILPYLDEDTQATIESGSMTGEEIVSKAMKESNGEDYINFCYAVKETVATQNTDYLLDSAREILPSDKYNEVEAQIADIEHHLGDVSKAMTKKVQGDQQEAFYSDLRALVVKTSVLLVAGIVYACMPTAIVWGKVTAAAALAVGAGVVSGVVMDIYGHYEMGFELNSDLEEVVTSEKTFESWINQFKGEPEAYYAIATSVISIASSMELDPVVTGIILVVFAAYNVWSTIQTMKKTYNFDA